MRDQNNIAFLTYVVARSVLICRKVTPKAKQISPDSVKVTDKMFSIK